MTSDTPRGRGRPRQPIPDLARAKELQSVSVQVRVARAELAELEARRDLLIGQALADGWTHGQLAEVTGLSRGRISQL